MRDGVFALVPEPFDPNQVFENICNLLGPQATAKGVEITSSIVKNLILPHDESLSAPPPKILDQPLPKLVGDSRRFK